MKKLISVILAVVMMCTLFVPAFAQQEEKTKFVLLGDSIARGHGLISIKTQSYGAIVSEAEGYNYVNYAVDGHTTQDLYQRLKDKKVAADVSSADIIGVSIGGNNFLHGDILDMIADSLIKNDFSGMEDIGAEFRESFLTVLGKIKELNPKATLLMQTLYNPASGLLKETYQYAVDIINDTIKDVLRQQPGAYVIVDVASAFAGGTGYIQADTIHPNAAGHYVIAQEYVKVLFELGLGNVKSLDSVSSDDGLNAILDFLNKIADIFRNIIYKIKSLFI